MVNLSISMTLIYLSYIFILLGICMGWKHILSVLIFMEMLALTLFMQIMLTWTTSFEFFHSLSFLAVVTCESVLGISAMIFTTKVFGSDLIYNQSASLW